MRRRCPKSCSASAAFRSAMLLVAFALRLMPFLPKGAREPGRRGITR